MREWIDVTHEVRFKNLERFGFGPNVMKKTRVCVRCGRMARTRAGVCPSCGEKLPGETLFDRYKKQHASCPQCDTVLTSDAHYCPNCGTAVIPPAADRDTQTDCPARNCV